MDTTDYDESSEEESSDEEDEIYICTCGEHEWIRLHDGYRNEFPRRAIYMHKDHTRLLGKARVRRVREDGYYVNMVDNIVTEDILMNIIRGTNQHGENDATFESIAEDESGMHEIRIFICILIKRGYRNDQTRNMWKMDSTEGDWDVTSHMSRRRFYKIKKHICFNPYDDDDNHPFHKFMQGLDALRDNSLELFRGPHIRN